MTIRMAIVVARFNDFITERLLAGAVAALRAGGVAEGDMVVHRVPGAFEVPLAAEWAAQTGRVHGVVALGCLIRGATPHFEYISSACAHGLMAAQSKTGVPMAFGVLTTNSVEEAQERAVDGPGNKGAEAAEACLEMVRLRAGLLSTGGGRA